MPDVRGACALYYSYQVKGADGKIKVPFRRRTAHSFLKQYIQGLYLWMVKPVTSETFTDTGAASRTISYTTGMNTVVAAGTSTAGLVAGTGTNAVTITDSKLQTQIVHGTGSGQLDYGASTAAAPSSDSTSTTLILTRVFANSSGGSITVNEIGVYAQMVDTGSTSRNICVVRDTTTIALSNGDQLTLNYILKTTA